MAAFLLLHGACHGGWCFEKLTPLLEAAGHRVTAPDLPCDDPHAGLGDYADAAAASLDGDTADLVVVGHSLGALVVPLVATRRRTRRLVMLAGIVGAPGKSLAMLAEEDADRDLPLGDDALEFNEEGLFRFAPQAARRLLYADCADDDAEAAIARLRFQRSMWNEVAEFDAWPDVETVSIVCRDDRVVDPAWSERVARERLGVGPVLIDGGHSPFLSRPAELAAILTAGL